eukprot:9915910-Alexandrium_andersonii.AAC.1
MLAPGDVGSLGHWPGRALWQHQGRPRRLPSKASWWLVLDLLGPALARSGDPRSHRGALVHCEW